MKTALVTGAGGGIGAAIAGHAARSGYRVLLLDIDGAAAEAVAATLPGAIVLQADVTDEASVSAALARAGVTPDLLVNNAGRVVFAPLADQEIATFKAVVDVNLNGTFVPSWLIGRRMLARGSGSIVNVSSIGGIVPAPNTGAYSSAKAAIIRLTEHMAVEWGPRGIRVNCVAPGFIDAGMSAPLYRDPAVRKPRSDAVPSRRLGTAGDVANAVLFLASEEAAYINGHVLVVDGGVVHSVLAQLPNRQVGT